MYRNSCRFLVVPLIMIPVLVWGGEGKPPLQIDAPLQTLPVPVAESPRSSTSSELKTRIGFVDTGRIAAESEQGKALKVLLSAKKDALQEKVTARKKQLDKVRAAIEPKLASMTPSQREAKSREFQKKVEELQKLAQKSEEEFYGIQEKESKLLYEAIERAATAYGTTAGLALVVVKKELLYVAGTVDAQDVTDSLIKALNLSNRKK